MATIKVKFRPSAVIDQEGSVYYQIIHERKIRLFFPGYHILPREWNDNRNTVIVNLKSERMSQLLYIKERIRSDTGRFAKIIRKLDYGGIDYTPDDVIDEYLKYSREYSLFNYMEGMIARLKQMGKLRTSETYKSALNSFEKFRDNEDIMLDNITSEVMEKYEMWQKNRGVSSNTISFYFRILRAAYHRAVEDDIIEDRNPFRHVYTGIDKTVKRALPLSIIKQIKTLDLTLMPDVDFARDMFMLSFYLRGMSFVDMTYLKKTDLKNGYVSYRRSKTNQLLTIEWTKEMQMILDKYPENESEYLLPIIKTSDSDTRWVYRNIGHLINRKLKSVAKMVQLSIPLTMYVARHSWASVAKSKGIPVSVISEGMGHDSEATTKIYLATLNTSVVDRANSVILRALR